MACRVDDRLRSSEWLFVWIVGEKKKRLATTTTTWSMDAGWIQFGSRTQRRKSCRHLPTHTQRERENQKAQTIICRHYRVCTKLSPSQGSQYSACGQMEFRRFSSLWSFDFHNNNNNKVGGLFFLALFPAFTHTHTKDRTTKSTAHEKKKIYFIFGFAFSSSCAWKWLTLNLFLFFIFGLPLFFDIIVCDTAVT